MKVEIADDAGQTPAPSRRSFRALPYVVAVSFYTVFVVQASGTVDGKRTFPLFDDAMISMTYARNLARGDGLVWNAGGERVEGITNFLWTVVMAVPHLLGVSDRYAGLVMAVLGVVIVCVCASLSAAIAARLAPDQPAAASAASWLVLFCYPLVFWTLRGMEVGLLTALVLGALLCALRYTERAERRDLVILAALVAAGCLTRIDFLIFVPVLAAFLAFTGAAGARRAGVTAVLSSAAVTMVAQELARFAYYDRWVPNTYTLKVGNTALADRLDRGIRAAVFTFVVSMAAAAVLAGLAYWKRRSPGILLLAGSAAMTILYNAYVGGDAWEWMRFANRYLTPGLVLLLTLAAIGAYDFVAAVKEPGVWRTVAALLLLPGALVLLGVLPGGGVLFRAVELAAPGSQRIAPLFLIGVVLIAWPGFTLETLDRFLGPLLVLGLALSVNASPIAVWSSNGALYHDFDVDVARAGVAASAVTTPDAHLAVVRAGNSIYYARRAGVDILGKSDRGVAAGKVRPESGFVPGHMKWNYTVTLAQQPDLVVDLWLQSCEDRQLFVDNGYVEAWPREPSSVRHESSPFLARDGSPNVLWERLHVRTRAETARRLLADC